MPLTSLLGVFLTRSLKGFKFENKGPENLDFSGLQELGLYVHIPFCRSICSFCPYCKMLYDQATARHYKEALLNEIDLVGRRSKLKKKATTLYFGGGTPALMRDDLGEIIAAIQQYFEITEGIGIELHPADISEEVLEKLKQSGISMVCVGVQSFQEKCLSALGRRQEGIQERLQLVKEADFAVFDIDLIFALPHQTEESLLDDVKQAFSCGATQVSVYPFIDFSFAQNNWKPRPERIKKRMLAALCRHCAEMGKERTSIWTFAEKGTARYSSVTRDNFLGFGLSAATLLPSQFTINTFSLQAYLARIRQNQPPTALTLRFTKRQRAAYHLFWSAYSTEISSAKFEKMFNASLFDFYGFELRIGEKLGLLRKVGADYHLTERGAYYFHLLEQTYTTAYIDKMWSVLSREPFPQGFVL